MTRSFIWYTSWLNKWKFLKKKFFFEGTDFIRLNLNLFGHLKKSISATKVYDTSKCLSSKDKSFDICLYLIKLGARPKMTWKPCKNWSSKFKWYRFYQAKFEPFWEFKRINMWFKGPWYIKMLVLKRQIFWYIISTW